MKSPGMPSATTRSSDGRTSPCGVISRWLDRKKHAGSLSELWAQLTSLSTSSPRGYGGYDSYSSSSWTKVSPAVKEIYDKGMELKLWKA